MGANTNARPAARLAELAPKAPRWASKTVSMM